MKYQYVLVACFALLLGLSYYVGYTPLALGAVFLVASTVAYILYAMDKSAAVAGGQRVPERTLHTVAVLFGWPGALVAQQRLRHKTKKQSFRIVFWLTVLINITGVAWLHGPLGNKQLRAGAHHLESFAITHVPYNAPVSALLALTRFRSPGVE